MDEKKVIDLTESPDVLIRKSAENAIDCVKKRKRKPSSSEAVLHFAASKVASVVGLHDYVDTIEEFIDHVYQDLPELLEQDAQTLKLKIIPKAEELDKLIHKTGKALSSDLNEILTWATKGKDTTKNSVATDLSTKIEKLVGEAKKNRKLNEEEAKEVKRSLNEKVRQSVGNRNENLAIMTYERQTGSKVSNMNDRYYQLICPPLPTPLHQTMDKANCRSEEVDFNKVDKKIEQSSSSMNVNKKVFWKRRKMKKFEEESQAYFKVCGMVDGMTDVVEISENDEWEMKSIVIEVKNRINSFKNPPPLYDHIQMLVYMKMVGCEKGDFIQCMNTKKTDILVSRLSLDQAPYVSKGNKTSYLWTDIVLPRLYTYAKSIYAIRKNDLLRLALLNGTVEEQRGIISKFCPFLSES